MESEGGLVVDEMTVVAVPLVSWISQPQSTPALIAASTSPVTVKLKALALLIGCVPVAVPLTASPARPFRVSLVGSQLDVTGKSDSLSCPAARSEEHTSELQSRL